MIGALYGSLTSARRTWYERHPHARKRLARPVISVGNLVTGGSGKTPVVSALARMLRAAGESPAILTRGYARRIHDDGVVVVSDGDRVLEPVERSGDEPQMLARALPGVPVLVSPDRYLAGSLAERRFGATVLILDDGFQHLQLARDVDLLLVSADDLDARLLPQGQLREPLAAAKAADALIVFGSGDEAGRIAARLGVDAVFSASVRYGELETLAQGSGIRDQGSECPTCVVAVAGIARPARFFDALRARGWDVRREMTFPDHHWFTPRDVEQMKDAAREVKANRIVTTEKDAVRLGVTDPMFFPPFFYLPMDVVIEPADAFSSWLRERL